jgi:hypothetical protein
LISLFARGLRIALLALVQLSTVAAAQTDTAAASIRRAAVAAFRDHPNAARNSAVASRPLVLDPIVLRGVFENGIRGQTPALPVNLDSAQAVSLATALGATVANSAETIACSRQEGRDVAPNQCKLIDVVIVSVGEPRPAGSEMALMMKTTSPLRLANGSITLTRYGSTYLLRLNRVDGVWRVRCLTNIPDGGPPSDPSCTPGR